MGCGPTGAVLYRVAEWSVLATEDESWLVGFGCTATVHNWTAIAAVQAKGLRTPLERFGGILGLQKNSEKTTRNYPKQYSYSDSLTENQSWEKPKETARKACQTNS